MAAIFLGLMRLALVVEAAVVDIILLTVSTKKAEMAAPELFMHAGGNS